MDTDAYFQACNVECRAFIVPPTKLMLAYTVGLLQMQLENCFHYVLLLLSVSLMELVSGNQNGCPALV